MSLSDYFSHRARILLIADPDTDPEQLHFVQDLLVTGGTGAESYQMQQGTEAYYEQMVKAIIERPDIDAVILLRTEVHPSREVRTAHRLAREIGKPVQALAVEGVEVGLEVDETHALQVDPNDQSWHGLQHLRQWAIEFPQKYGHPIR